jgi:hypothetical protein
MRLGFWFADTNIKNRPRGCALDAVKTGADAAFCGIGDLKSPNLEIGKKRPRKIKKKSRTLPGLYT